MTITFYKISDDRRQVSKTLNNTTKIKDSTGRLKTDCSVMDPIIEMSYDVDLLQCNYMYIPEFSRYYFINKIEVGAQRMYLTAHVDVLQTYAASIRELDCIVARQESDGKANFYLNDKMFRAHNFKILKTIAFPSTPFMEGNNNVDSLVLTVGGGY